MIRLKPGESSQLSSSVLLSTAAAADASAPASLLLLSPGAAAAEAPPPSLPGAGWIEVCRCNPQAQLRGTILPAGSWLTASGGELHLVAAHVPGGRKQENDAAATERSLARDLEEWVGLCAQRRALAERAAAEGQAWEAQAEAQKLPIDWGGLKLHRACAAEIQEHGLQRGAPVGLEATLSALCARRAAATGAPTRAKLRREERAAPPRRWREVALGGSALEAVATDALSFPLSGALLAYLAGVDGAETLTVHILGPEPAAELRCRRKWLAMLAALPHVRSLRLLFCGPRVPARLDGVAEELVLTEASGGGGAGSGGGGRGAGGRLSLAFLRGDYHHRRPEAPAKFGQEQLAIAFHPGLAEHAADWAPSLRPLLRRGTPVGLTAYHPPEAELDARTLAALGGAAGAGGAGQLAAAPRPNPLASRLPHLDELFPGRTYAANAFITLAAPGRGACVAKQE